MRSLTYVSDASPSCHVRVHVRVHERIVRVHVHVCKMLYALQSPRCARGRTGQQGRNSCIDVCLNASRRFRSSVRTRARAHSLLALAIHAFIILAAPRRAVCVSHVAAGRCPARCAVVRRRRAAPRVANALLPFAPCRLSPHRARTAPVRRRGSTPVVSSCRVDCPVVPSGRPPPAAPRLTPPHGPGGRVPRVGVRRALPPSLTRQYQ